MRIFYAYLRGNRIYSIHRSEEFCENRTENRKGARAGYKIRTENAPIVVRVF